ncbi:MAG: hypothetical protein JWL72_3724, partial [Ilumatobacteraceae bacterium]|nr:hypothetical protein [Ilumatobacteraceae bacterium]
MQSEPAEVNSYDDANVCFEESSARVFRWLCRIAGPTVGRAQLPGVYRRAAESLPIGDDRLFADALRLARQTAEDVERLAIFHRAILQLVAVDGSAAERVGRVTLLGVADVDDAVEAATAWFASRVASGESVDDVLRRSEVWLDDELRDACRRAMTDEEPGAGSARRSTRSSPQRVGVAWVVVAACAAATVWFTIGQSNRTTTTFE